MVEDFENLEGLSLEKLYKLRDVADDYMREKWHEAMGARARVAEIMLAISNKQNEDK